MTTYGDNTTNRFYHLVRRGYRNTFALIDHKAGDVRAQSGEGYYSCLKPLLDCLSDLQEQYEANGQPSHFSIVNCRTGEEIYAVKEENGVISYPKD